MIDFVSVLTSVASALAYFDSVVSTNTMPARMSAQDASCPAFVVRELDVRGPAELAEGRDVGADLDGEGRALEAVGDDVLVARHDALVGREELVGHLRVERHELEARDLEAALDDGGQDVAELPLLDDVGLDEAERAGRARLELDRRAVAAEERRVDADQGRLDPGAGAQHALEVRGGGGGPVRVDVDVDRDAAARAARERVSQPRLELVQGERLEGPEAREVRLERADDARQVRRF